MASSSIRCASSLTVPCPSRKLKGGCSRFQLEGKSGNSTRIKTPASMGNKTLFSLNISVLGIQNLSTRREGNEVSGANQVSNVLHVIMILLHRSAGPKMLNRRVKLDNSATSAMHLWVPRHDLHTQCSALSAQYPVSGEGTTMRSSGHSTASTMLPPSPIRLLAPRTNLCGNDG
jgi:hypothetical protein